MHQHTDNMNILNREAERIRVELQHYFAHSSQECPYGLPLQALYNQSVFPPLPDFIMDAYLASGYRRNGNVLYSMHCPECRACVPLRVAPDIFKPNRIQKRTWRKNRDVTIEIAPPACSEENLALLDKFLRGRYPGRDSSPRAYYSSFFLNRLTTTLEFRYRLGSQLLGVAIVDLASTWLNVVFFYFDPVEGKRSLGVYNILYLIDFCRQQGIIFLYLGYWIKDIPAMSYKANFRPHSIYLNDTWEQVSN
jgi:arginine-tRNA-protein transferase